MRKTGANHSAPPSYVPPLSARANLSRMVPVGHADWQSGMTLGDPLGNDKIGNCVPCFMLRAEQMIQFNAVGSSWTPTVENAIALYSRYGKYDPNDPSTDQGTDVPTLMNGWSSNGYLVNSQLEDVPHWASLDPQNLDYLRIAIDTLGPIGITLDLPKAAMLLDEWTIAPDGSPDTEPGSEGGHQIACGRYDADGFYAVTWGQQIFMSPEFVRFYALAAQAIISRFWLTTTGLSPSGLDLVALQMDAAAIRSA